MSNDHTTDMLIDMLRGHVAAEPPQDMGMHPSEELQAEVGNIWAEWARQRRALELVLAPRLLREALAEVEKT